MKVITAVLLGAGGRGTIYGNYALKHPEQIKFVAVADPLADRREAFAKNHGIKDENVFSSFEDCFKAGKLADCIFICTQDKDHYVPAMAALELKYDIVLEKPIACTAKECKDIYTSSLKNGCKVAVCHVLRHTDFYKQIKEIIDSGKLGKITQILMRENIGNYHYANSFVRGEWRREEDSNPIILAKCCHDLDLMYWYAKEDCTKVSSYGSSVHFNIENKPEGAPKYCVEGCPMQTECPYYAPKLYTTIDWLRRLITLNGTDEDVIEGLKTSKYGRCVYQCDNNVLDHQVVNMEFADGCIGTLVLNAFTPEIDREIYILGTKGELRGIFADEQTIIINDIMSGKKIKYTMPPFEGVHGGGDNGFMADLVKSLNNTAENNTDISVSINSHILGYAAEKARHTNTVVDFKDFCDKL